ncbi:MAG: cph2 1 [Bacillales bacterium]|jgi:diguanylate cyclase (GGDEF)-like protein/PAS domain S-box-containing protein|nr:cph2 1 [Bacillales bacterium]
MYIDLLHHLTLTAVFIFSGGILSRNNPLETYSPLLTRIYAGLGSGLLGILLMLSTIHVTDKVIVDLRYIPIIISAIFAGPVASVIAGTIIGLMRIILFDINEASISSALLAIGLGMSLGVISTLKISRVKKYLAMNVFSVCISASLIYMLIPNSIAAVKLLSFYIPIAIIGGVFTYYFAEFIKRSNDNNREIMFYKLIAENSTDLITTHNLDGTFKYISPSSKSILGYESNELVGESPYKFLYYKDKIDFQKTYESMIETLKDNVSTYRFKHKNGEYVWLETKSRISNGDEIISFSRDVTAKRKAKEELLEANKKLQQLSNIDGLTEIANRRYFDTSLEKEWKRGLRNKTPVSLIMFDIDYFKLFNDTYGHQKGDDCLKKIASTAQTVLNRPTDIIARYGGEEFAVILSETNQEGAIRVADRIRSCINDLGIEHENSMVEDFVTVSIGVATLIPSIDTDHCHLINNADKALYKAKKNGQNQIELYIEEMSNFEV